MQQQPFSTEMLTESVLYFQERLPDACLVLQLANSPVVKDVKAGGAGPRGAALSCPGDAVPPASCSLTGPGAELGQLQQPSPTFLLLLQRQQRCSWAAPMLLLRRRGCCRSCAAGRVEKRNTELLSHAATPGQPGSLPSQTSAVGISEIRGGSCHQSLTCFMFPDGPSLASCPQGLQLPVPLLPAGIAMGTAHLPLASAAGLRADCTAPVGACTPPKLLGGGSSKGPWETGEGDQHETAGLSGMGGCGWRRKGGDAPLAISRGDYFWSSVFLN